MGILMFQILFGIQIEYLLSLFSDMLVLQISLANNVVWKGKKKKKERIKSENEKTFKGEICEK